MSLTDRFNEMDNELYLRKQAMLYETLVQERDALERHLGQINNLAYTGDSDSEGAKTLKAYLKEEQKGIEKWGQPVVAAIHNVLRSMISGSADVPVRIVTDGEKAQIILPTLLRDSSGGNPSMLAKYFMKLVDDVGSALSFAYCMGSEGVEIPPNSVFLTYTINDTRIVDKFAKAAKSIAEGANLTDDFLAQCFGEVRRYYSPLGIKITLERYYGRLFSLAPAPETAPAAAPPTAPAEPEKPGERLEVKQGGANAQIVGEKGTIATIEEAAGTTGLEATVDKAAQDAAQEAGADALGADKQKQEEDLSYLLKKKPRELTSDDVKKLEEFLRYDQSTQIDAEAVPEEERLSVKQAIEALETIGVHRIDKKTLRYIRRAGFLRYVKTGENMRGEIVFFPASEIRRIKEEGKAQYFDLFKKYYMNQQMSGRGAETGKGSTQPEDEPDKAPEEPASLVARINQTKVDELKGRNKLIAEAFANNPDGIDAKMPLNSIIDYVHQHGPKLEKGADVERIRNSIGTSISIAAKDPYNVVSKIEKGIYALQDRFIMRASAPEDTAPQDKSQILPAAPQGEPEGIEEKQEDKTQKGKKTIMGKNPAPKTVNDNYIDKQLATKGKSDALLDVIGQLSVAGKDPETGEPFYLKTAVDEVIKQL